VLAAVLFDFAVGVGVVQTQRPVLDQIQIRGELEALGGGAVQVHRIAGVGVGTLNQAAADHIDGAGGAGDLVRNPVVEGSQASAPTLQAVIMHADFGAGAHFRLKVGVAHVDLGSLSRNAVHAAV